VVYDNSKTIKYLNLDGEMVGMEKTSSNTKKKYKKIQKNKY